jgi:hypothetical protein
MTRCPPGSISTGKNNCGCYFYYFYFYIIILLLASQWNPNKLPRHRLHVPDFIVTDPEQAPVWEVAGQGFTGAPSLSHLRVRMCGIVSVCRARCARSMLNDSALHRFEAAHHIVDPIPASHADTRRQGLLHPHRRRPPTRPRPGLGRRYGLTCQTPPATARPQPLLRLSAGAQGPA